MSQRVPSKRSRAANISIENRSQELQMLGYPPKQAVAIALRQWNDGELNVVQVTNTTPELKKAESQLNFMKTVGALTSFYKARQKQIEQERSKTMSRADRLKRFEDE